MALLHPSPISSDRFTVGNNVLSVEASDLGRDFRLGPVYDDACDEGFTVVSARTGLEAVFYAAREIRDREGELQMHVFQITPESARMLGVPSTFRVEVYND